MSYLKNISRLLLFVLAATLSLPAAAALNAYAELTANGTALTGTTTTDTMGGIDVTSDHIEVYAYSQTAEYKRKPASSPRRASRARFAGPIVLMKRQDATSPLFYKALFNAEIIEGTFKFFGRDPDSGEIRLESTVEITGALVTSVQQRVPDTFNANDANYPTLDIIEIVPESITWENVISGTSTTWSAR